MPERSRRSAMRSSGYAASSLTSFSSWRRPGRSLRDTENPLRVGVLDVDVLGRDGRSVDLDPTPGLRDRGLEAGGAHDDVLRAQVRRAVLGLLDEGREPVVPRLDREPGDLDLGRVLRGHAVRDVDRRAALDACLAALADRVGLVAHVLEGVV